MKRLWLTQILAVIRLEMKKTFFAPRGLWIYLLALAPVALFLGHSMVEVHLRGVRHDLVQRSGRHVTEQDLESIHKGATRDEVMAKLGPPPEIRLNRRVVRAIERQRPQVVSMETFRYTDGARDYIYVLESDAVVAIEKRATPSLGEDSYIFAGVFEFFFIRLAIFFGCLGIFMNLFRGEMLDKSLHFYLLAPIRREVLVAGKYLAGLLVAAVVFTLSVALQMYSLSLAFDSAAIHHFLYEGNGFSQIGAYIGVTMLACVGYGSIFLAAGLVWRNPIVAAVVVLIWEAANPVLPALLKKFSVIYYLKSLCPVEIPADPGMPAILSMLISNADPISPYIAVFGLLAVSLAVLILSGYRARRLEINYTTE